MLRTTVPSIIAILFTPLVLAQDCDEWPRTHLAGSDTFGSLLQEIPDLNSDGTNDYVANQPGWNGQGRLLVLSGATGDLLNTITETPASINFGERGASTIPDKTGDGVDEWAVLTHTQGLFIYDGALGTTYSTPTSPSIPSLGGVVGTSIHRIEDISGDGIDEIAFGISNGLPNKGIKVLDGATLLELPGSPILSPPGAHASFGQTPDTVSCLPDINGDNVADLAIGDRGVSNDQGQVFIYSGAELASGVGNLLLRNWTDTPLNSYFGRPIKSAGDVDGDGVGDLFVGAPNRDGAFSNQGRVFLISGSSTNLTSPLATFDGEGSFDNFGYRIDFGADLNVDGMPELLISAQSAEGTFSSGNAGVVYIYSGTLDGTLLRYAFGDFGGTNFGVNAKFISDLDGDGVEEFVGTASSYLRIYPGEDPSDLAFTYTPCIPVSNSTGVPGELDLVNTTTSFAVDDPEMQLTAFNLPLHQFSYPMVSREANAGIALGLGVFCLNDNSATPNPACGFLRLNDVQYIKNSGTTGSAVFDIVMDTNLPQPSTMWHHGVRSGETWHFQVWHRENSGDSQFTETVGFRFR